MTNRILLQKIRLGALLVLLAGGFSFRAYFTGLGTKPAVENAPFTCGERTLIIAPHPDDETLGGAGVIQKALKSGKQVKVVIMTTGDGFTKAAKESFGVQKPQPSDYQRLGELRHKETLAVMKHFGVDVKDVLFLGYPDGGVAQLWDAYWDYSQLYRGSTGSTHSPYRFSYQKQAPYCGTNVVRNLSEIIASFNPTDIVYPDPNDSHHDHWGTGAFVKYVLTERKYNGHEWTFLVHRREFPAHWQYEPAQPLLPPTALQQLDAKWVKLPLNEAERSKKLAAITKYKSQTKVMRMFLESFVRENELLGVYQDPVLPAVLRDAKADTRIREAEPGADIIKVTADAADRRFQIGIEANGPINARAMYNIRMRVFRPEGVSRLDLTAQGSQLTARKYAGNSLDLPPACSLKTDGSRLSISLPIETILGASGVLLSTDSFIELERIDRTAWRLIRMASNQ